MVEQQNFMPKSVEFCELEAATDAGSAIDGLPKMRQARPPRHKNKKIPHRERQDETANPFPFPFPFHTIAPASRTDSLGTVLRIPDYALSVWAEGPQVFE